MSHILVVDDDPILLDLISATLQFDGHQTTALDNPLTAFDQSRVALETIDLLVTDVDMKPISGFELVARLHSAGFSPPVLFTSGHSILSPEITGRLTGRAILAKPFTTAQFRAAVRGVLDVSRKSSGPRGS
jgi:DNA-binding response OmpR family regulator